MDPSPDTSPFADFPEDLFAYHRQKKESTGLSCSEHPIPFFSISEANLLEKIQCSLCHKKFPDLNALLQHNRAKHFASKILIDENVSSNEPSVRELCRVYRHKLKEFPSNLLGKTDELVIQYAHVHNYGLVTRDKRCARVAVQYLSPVYLLVNEKTHTSVIKFN
jgi:predicted nuclease of predicted toxin-antitoxin system